MIKARTQTGQSSGGVAVAVAVVVVDGRCPATTTATTTSTTTTFRGYRGIRGSLSPLTDRVSAGTLAVSAPKPTTGDKPYV
jgi:hypothetical protein